MAKFYVASGELRVVVQADDARTAALWAMHLAMSRSLNLDGIEPSLDQRIDLATFDAVARFDRWMKISEIGFGREEAGKFDSLDIMIEWNQLATAIVRLERLIESHEPPAE